VFGVTAKQKTTAKGGRESMVLDELEELAGKELDELPVDKINLLREVVSDSSPTRRWLSLSELPVIEFIRNAHPNGLSPAQRKKLEEAVKGL